MSPKESEKILLTGVAPGRSNGRSRSEWKRRYNEKYRHGCMDEENTAAPEKA